jgi:hypothetical protein
VRLHENSGADDRALPGWERDQGMEEFQLVDADLFQVKRIRIEIEDDLW